MKKIAILIILIIAIGCKNKSNLFCDNFELVDSLKVKIKELDGVSIIRFYNNINQDKENLFLFYKNEKILSVNESLEKVKLEVSLKCLDSMTFRGFLYINSDSLFISTINKNTNEMFISLINSEGAILKNWNISKYSDIINNAYFYIDANYLHPLVLIGNSIYFHASYNFKPGTIIKSIIPIEMKLDLSNDSITKIGDLPNEYKSGEFYGNYQKEYSRTFNNKEEIIFSFPICNHLYVYDKNGVFIKKVECKSKYIDKVESILKEKYFDLSSIIDSYVYNAQYADIIFDKYNELYYRLALHKLIKYDKSGKVNNWTLRKWSIIILDKDFKIINEVLMPVNKFMRYITLTDKGIMMNPIGTVCLNKYYIFKYNEKAN